MLAFYVSSLMMHVRMKTLMERGDDTELIFGRGVREIQRIKQAPAGVHNNFDTAGDRQP